GLAIDRQSRSARATSLPASRMSASSRGDFSSGGCWKRDRSTVNSPQALFAPWGEAFDFILAVFPDGLGDVGVNRFDVPLGAHAAQQALAFVVGDQAGVVLVVDRQARAHGFLLVVLALAQGGAAHVALARLSRRVEN